MTQRGFLLAEIKPSRYLLNKHSNAAASPLDEFEELGVHLLWQMYDTGVISKDEEKRLTKILNAQAEVPDLYVTALLKMNGNLLKRL